MDAACPCGSGGNYGDCCQRYHTHQATASTAEQLMRSRYCAFVVGDNRYLRDSWHPDFRPQDPLISDDTPWLGLRILAAPAPQADAATVEFVAFYSQQGRVAQLHERSRFIRMDGRWYYTEGDQLPAIKLARNDRCCCGSGRKQKHCHAEC